MLSKSNSLLQSAEEGNWTMVCFSPGTVLAEANVEELAQRLNTLIIGRDQPHLSIDLSGVTLLTSVVLGKFITLNNNLRIAGGKLRLVNPNPVVRQVFQVTRLDTIFEIHTTSEPLSA